MSNLTPSHFIALSLAAALSTLGAFAAPQAKPSSQSAMKKQFAAMTDKASPLAEQHKLLDAFVGEFDQTTTVAMGPGEPMKVHSLAKGQRIIDGRFVKFESTSAPDEELKGERMLVYGYDPAQKKFTLWNIESGSSVPTTATGDYDAAAKTFTFDGEREQSGAGKVPFRWVMKLDDGGNIAQTIQMKFPGAPDYATVIAVQHTRKKK